MRRLVAELLRAQAGLAAGAGIVLAPGTLADAPRCIEWWWADQQAQVSQLHVDLDPESAEFYDYTTTEWYREPERTGQPSVAGPYVDFICTRQYTFTLAAPIRCAGRFIGVAGADILATQVERLVSARAGRAGLHRGAGQCPRPGHRLDQREPAARCGAAPPARGRRIRPIGRAGPAAAGGPGAGARPAAVDAARRSHWMIMRRPGERPARRVIGTRHDPRPAA